VSCQRLTVADLRQPLTGIGKEPNSHPHRLTDRPSRKAGPIDIEREIGEVNPTGIDNARRWTGIG
jgi:hypothetical protein